MYGTQSGRKLYILECSAKICNAMYSPANLFNIHRENIPKFASDLEYLVFLGYNDYANGACRSHVPITIQDSKRWDVMRKMAQHIIVSSKEVEVARGTWRRLNRDGIWIGFWRMGWISVGEGPELFWEEKMSWTKARKRKTWPCWEIQVGYNRGHRKEGSE